MMVVVVVVEQGWGGGVKLLKTDLQFKWINFQFCGMGEATEFSEIIKNLTK